LTCQFILFNGITVIVKVDKTATD